MRVSLLCRFRSRYSFEYLLHLLDFANHDCEQVPVFEFIADTKNGPEYVMRRRQDNWINATHILKVAEQQKASRTRILEREVQKDVHEKIQGGYGKFQGLMPREPSYVQKLTEC